MIVKETRLSPPTIEEMKQSINHPYWEQRQRLAMFLYANRDKTEQDFFK